MKYYNSYEVLERLQKTINASGMNQKEFAKSIFISPAYLNDILHMKREPGFAVLAAIGFERKVLYRRVK